jgi:phosphate starvation-inducible PhoH-like protein
MKVAKIFQQVFGSSETLENPRLPSQVEVQPGDATPAVQEQEQTNNNTAKDKMAKKKHGGYNLGKMQLKNVKPITFTQQEVFREFLSGGNLCLHGIAGTGKSFVGLYLALKECERYQLQYHKVIILRSGVPSRDMGYLPGNMQEKAAVYEEPYRQIVNKLYDRGDAYDIMKHHGNIEFATTSFLRGVTFENAIILVDEIQNMTYGELATIMTRVGDKCRIIFAGDFRQTDLFRTKEKEGLHHFLNIIQRMPEFSFHEFNIGDIVRGKLVKSFLTEDAEYRDKTPSFEN